MRSKTKKFIAIASLFLVIGGVVGASVFSYFGTLETEMNTKQALRLDGHIFDEVVTEQFNAMGGDVIKTTHLISNGGSMDANISTCVNGLPVGIVMSYHYVNNSVFTLPITVDAGANLDFQI